ncbi:DUF4381 domain-containing protein [Cellvibrio sp. NN19]|uniref:DUF4381 domain-containing protein n=1 Tax=Cellvibrio chitinivorans TaxID=3102792 RepID=UPI002B417503|nr:DUF4381 domain-containing protein [Cellvibrio sp. NN19]
MAELVDSTAPSLDALKELPLPPVVPYTPQTIGWVILAAVVIVLICWNLWRNYQYRLANRYRVEALAELDQIEQALGSHPSAAAQLPTLIKRVALTAAPRADIAALSGDAWLQWLDASLPQAGFLDAPGKLIPALAYSSPANSQIANPKELHALLALTRRWIREHHV